MCGLSLVATRRGYSLLQCAGFSLWWLLLLRSMGSRRAGFSSCGSQAPEHRLSSCDARAQLLRSMWDLPGPGLESVSPALAGGFLTPAPPRKSTTYLYIWFDVEINIHFSVQVEIQMTQHHLLKRPPFSHFTSVRPFVINQVTDYKIRWTASVLSVLFRSTDQFLLCQYHTILTTIAL